MTDEGKPPAFAGADVGINLVICVLVGGGLGYLLDRWLGWQPWAMLVGGVLGFGAWFRTLMRMTSRN